MAKYVKGNDAVISIWDADAEAWRPIGCETSHTLTENQEVTEGEGTKCDPNPSRSLGAYTYSVDADAKMIHSDDENYSDKANYEFLRERFKGQREDSEEIEWRLTGADYDQFGKGYITDLSRTGAFGDDAEFSLSIEGIGEIEETDPHYNENNAE